MAGLTLDAGALIMADRGDRSFWAFWKERTLRRASATVPGPVLAQAWRGPESARIALVLSACRVEAMDEQLAKLTGELCGRARTADIVDACVIAGAARRGDDVLTTDPKDLVRLAAFASGTVRILDLSEF